MSDLGEAFSRALALIVAADPALLEIVGLSLKVTLSAVFLAALLGLPLAAAIACFRFPGRGLLIATLNAFMGLPPVVVGLVVYLLLSRSGPLGTLGLLFTPSAMILAQTILVLPIVTAVARQSLSDMESDSRELLRSLGAGPWRRVPTLLFEARLSLTTAVLAGFGRAAGEVGAVMIVGGNIDHVTRTMTTAIALETSKGHLAGALALGLILIALSATIALATQVLRDRAARKGQVAER